MRGRSASLWTLVFLVLAVGPAQARKHHHSGRARSRHDHAQTWRQPRPAAPTRPAPLAAPAAQGCRLRFLGAAGMVTGSMHMLEAGGRRLLVDCGMRQGRDRGQLGDRVTMPPEAVAADAMVLTHAHVDHSGDIPLLVKSGFRGKIHCTPATADLCRALLEDSARLQQRRSKAHRGDRRGPPPEPRYTEVDVENALRHLETHRVGEQFCAAPGMTVCFTDAGHIAGAASAVVTTETRRGQQRRIAFSGDIGRRNSLIVKDPVPPAGGDYVVMESTYGGRSHGPIQNMKQEIWETIRDTQRRGGKVIIPAFSVHRTQQVLFLLSQLNAEGKLRLPVFVDSPLSAKATQTYRRHTECRSPAVSAFARRHGDPYSFSSLRVISSVEGSKQLNHLRGPAVIVSSAGMANAGRILHHLAHNLGDRRNTVAIVGHMSPGTPGRALRDGQQTVTIHGREIKVNAQVRRLSSFSGHADQNDLLWWARGCGAQVKRFFLVHGEPAQSQGLAEALRREGRQVAMPRRDQVFDLD